ncbi:hypothetical protein P171DRAFT_409910 [Karstenula rhodostoma CBS 690.94]|uniref:Uncharacterized protein n=1 Tax=Karstenula rhodostoma CBS 690.94 TaxID=1392251 RepID=A0A9P4UED4_9PLEO|nr:hypothetical protein P171DRAFT_409910 [Karstenula rhodostoma CBS 690.94]
MTSLFPHAPYAEDQPSAHAILHLHVARASAMTTTTLAFLTAPASLLLSRYRHATPLTFPAYSARLLTHASRGLVIGIVLGTAATFGQMYGREEIEWQDRAWRLQENGGEERTDVVSFGGAAVGAALGVWNARRGRAGMGMGMGRSVVGGAGLGSTSGMVHMIYSFARGRKSA